MIEAPVPQCPPWFSDTLLALLKDQQPSSRPTDSQKVIYSFVITTNFTIRAHGYFFTH
jgi:hypothetical protein